MKFPPALFLYILSPVIGELLSGSTPPHDFFKPIPLVLLMILYGGGAVLVRETTFLWGKGWPTVLVLGAAYGIVEEGLAVKSFFDPNWVDLGILRDYGRWLGVNWVWSLVLTVYHSVFSISLPIVLVQLLYPKDIYRLWLTKRTYFLLIFLWCLNDVFCFFYITAYRPPLIPFLVTLILVIVIVVYARTLPREIAVPKSSKYIRPVGMGIIGFLAGLIFFMSIYVLPKFSFHPFLLMSLVTGMGVGAARMLMRSYGYLLFYSASHQLALVSGALGIFIMLAPLQELDKTRLENTTGMAGVGMAMLMFLVFLTRRLAIMPQESPRQKNRLLEKKDNPAKGTS